MKCPHCQQTLPADYPAAYCPYCGNDFPAGEWAIRTWRPLSLRELVWWLAFGCVFLAPLALAFASTKMVVTFVSATHCLAASGVITGYVCAVHFAKTSRGLVIGTILCTMGAWAAYAGIVCGWFLWAVLRFGLKLG